MSSKEYHEIEAKAVMAFANMHVGAFDSGFVDGNSLTVYELHRSAQNYVNDHFDFTAKSLAEEWGNDIAVACRGTSPRWIKTAERLPTTRDRLHDSNEHIDCYIFINGEVLERPWNIRHECWDDRDYDDFQYNATEPSHWMIKPSTPSAPTT